MNRLNLVCMLLSTYIDNCLTFFAFIVGLTVLHGKYGDDFFRRAPLARQFKPGDNSHDDIISIDNLDSAKRAMKLIVDQGEGGRGNDGHYQIFEKLLGSGVPHHNVIDDPQTETFKDKPFYKVRASLPKIFCHTDNHRTRQCLSAMLHTAISFRRSKTCGHTMALRISEKRLL